jgi:hypothetical protein
MLELASNGVAVLKTLSLDDAAFTAGSPISRERRFFSAHAAANSTLANGVIQLIITRRATWPGHGHSSCICYDREWQAL